MFEPGEEGLLDAVNKERKRLYEYIRRRVPSSEDAEDILQDVFYEFVNSYRMMKPVEQIASWMFTVARNRITDFYRKKKPLLLEDQNFGYREEDEKLNIMDLIPSNSGNAESRLMSELIMETLSEALEELPEEQRQVFVLHELEDKSFIEISEMTGVNVNTLLSRKRYAVLHLRDRLRHLYNDLFES